MIQFLLMFFQGDPLATAFAGMLSTRRKAIKQYKGNQELLAQRESLNIRISSGVVSLGAHKNAYRESQRAIQDAYELTLD